MAKTPSKKSKTGLIQQRKPLTKKQKLFIFVPMVFALSVAAIGAFMFASTAATTDYVCSVGPVFTENGAPWYRVVLQNRSGVATTDLNDVAFEGHNAGGTSFIWNASKYSYDPQKYIIWKSGFSGVKILDRAVVLGQIRKPSTPAGVEQGNWKLIVMNKYYTCSTTTNVDTTATQYKAWVPPTPTPTPVPAPSSADLVYLNVVPAPAAASPVYAAWKLWDTKAGEAKAQNLRGTALATYVGPSKTAYEAALATATRSVSASAFACNVFSPTNYVVSQNNTITYNLTITNGSNLATSSLADITMKGTARDGSTVTINADTGRANYTWITGFSHVSIAPGSTVYGSITPDNRTAYTAWALQIFGKTVTCTNRVSTGRTPVPSPTPTPTTASVISPVLTCRTIYAPATLTDTSKVSALLVANRKSPAQVLANTYAMVLYERTATLDNQNPTKKELARYPLDPAKMNIGAATGQQVFNYEAAAVYPLRTSKLVTLYTALESTDGRTVILCNPGDITYNLSTGKKASLPRGALPSPKASPRPSATPKPKVESLGYDVKLLCVKNVNKKYVYQKNCSAADAVVLNVLGTETTPAKAKLDYTINFPGKKDKFGVANGCKKTNVVIGSTTTSLACAAVFKDKVGYLDGIVQSINNILRVAQRDTFLNRSEARADIAQLRELGQTQNLSVLVSLRYPGYETQYIKDAGTKLMMDEDVATAIAKIVATQKADCEAKGWVFKGTSEGCVKPKPRATPRPSGSPRASVGPSRSPVASYPCNYGGEHKVIDGGKTICVDFNCHVDPSSDRLVDYDGVDSTGTKTKYGKSCRHDRLASTYPYNIVSTTYYQPSWSVTHRY